MKKKVTKEEVERVLEQYLTPITKEPILNELFPPEFKVGDKVMVIGKRSIEARSLNGDVVELKTVSNNTVSTYVEMHYGMHFNEVRHATPEEIAAAEWEEGKPYKVWGANGEKLIRISAETVGMFYSFGGYSGNTIKYDKYEKI